MKIAVLFDGAGLARLGLEQAGHECTGFELDPWKHHLSKFVGSGNCELADVRDVDLSGFDAVWASPPCQSRSNARVQKTGLLSPYSGDFLEWSLGIPADVLWVENVSHNILSTKRSADEWGKLYNAAQFLSIPLQSRNRIIGGRHRLPFVHREYHYCYPGVCPAITASEFRGGKTDTRRASRFYGRRLTIQECAYHQGFTIPEGWLTPPANWSDTPTRWTYNLYEAIGNGVPVYMAKAFGAVYP